MGKTTSVAKVQTVVLPAGERTWTVVDDGHLVVAPAEEFLEFMRATGRIAEHDQVLCAGARAVVGVPWHV